MRHRSSDVKLQYLRSLPVTLSDLDTPHTTPPHPHHTTNNPRSSPEAFARPPALQRARLASIASPRHHRRRERHLRAAAAHRTRHRSTGGEGAPVLAGPDADRIDRPLSRGCPVCCSDKICVGWRTAGYVGRRLMVNNPVVNINIGWSKHRVGTRLHFYNYLSNR